MRVGHLSQYFMGVAAKRLTDVEVNKLISNQHEFQGINSLRGMLGTERQVLNAKYIYITDNEIAPLTVEATATWYDARIQDPKRSAEYKLYYPVLAETIIEQVSAGDFLVVAKQQNGSLLIIIADQGTTAENQLKILFNIDDNGENFVVKNEAEADSVPLGFVGNFVLEEIGIVVEDTNESYLEDMLSRFGEVFPKTRVFSDYARSTLHGIDSRNDADAAIIAWMEREETLFRTLERHIVGLKLETGFNGDLDEFVQFSLSVHNRRKSRVGYALENHLEQIFIDHSLSYSRTKETENRS